jgi:hypothetical protein
MVVRSSGLFLRTGVYTFTRGVTISSDITFRGEANDIFIIQMTGNLRLDANVNVILEGGIQAKNIFWQVAGNVYLMAGAHMEGILLVKTDITFITGSSLNGRVLSQTACNLQMATMTEPFEAALAQEDAAALAQEDAAAETEGDGSYYGVDGDSGYVIGDSEHTMLEYGTVEADTETVTLVVQEEPTWDYIVASRFAGVEPDSAGVAVCTSFLGLFAMIFAMAL